MAYIFKTKTPLRIRLNLETFLVVGKSLLFHLRASDNLTRNSVQFSFETKIAISVERRRMDEQKNVAINF